MSSGLLAILLSGAVLGQAERVELRTVGVLPVTGDARATRLLVETLRGYETLTIVSIADPDAVLGETAASRLRACADDACRAAVVAPLKTARLVIGEIDGRTLRLRLIDSSTASATRLAHVSEAVRGEDEGSLRAAMISGVSELFPELRSHGYGTLFVEADPLGASVWLDGDPIGTAPVGPLRVRLGRHEVRVEAPGHAPFRAEIVVELGQTARLSTDLDKNRRPWPLILGASGLGLAALGVTLGFSAQSVADEWQTGCKSNRCAPGFTRARWQDDRDEVSLKRNAANGLAAAAIGAGIAAVVYYILDPGADEEAP